jgi:hypothetical protein
MEERGGREEEKKKRELGVQIGEGERREQEKKRGCWAYRSERGEGIGGREVKKKKK